MVSNRWKVGSIMLVLAGAATACGDDSSGTGDGSGGATDTDPTTGTPGTTGSMTTSESSGAPQDCATLGQADVSADATLPAGCYDVPTSLRVESSLVLEAGVTLRFGESVRLEIEAGGSLEAQGTADAPVRLEPLDNTWGGLRLDGSSAPENRLAYVELSGVDGNALVATASTLVVEHSQITDNTGYGLGTEDGARVDLSSSTLSGNAIPVTVDIDAVPGIGSDNDLTGNTDDYVELRLGDVEDAATWQAPGVPYFLTENLDVDAALTLAPGVVLELRQDARIDVSETGSLNAVGTESSPITIRGHEDQPGYWRGIGVESKTIDNRISFAVIENAGSSEWTADDISSTAIWLTEESKLAVDNTTIRGSGGAAVMALNGSDLTGFSNNTIEDNAESLVLSQGLPDYLDASTSISGNTIDAVLIVRSYSEDAALTDATWPNIGVPYRVLEGFDVEGAWVIEPGVTIEFTQDRRLLVDPGASINAEGTAELPIRLVGTEPLSGFWQGIGINSLSTANVFDHVELRNAGSDEFRGTDSDGSLFVGGSAGDGRVELRNSTVGDSGGFGIVVWRDSSLVDCSAVTFENNAKADVSVHDSGASSDCAP